MDLQKYLFLFKNFLNEIFSNTLSVTIFTFCFFLLIYFLFASLAFFIERLIKNPVHLNFQHEQIKKEILYSLRTIIIFALGILVVKLGLFYKIISVHWKFEWFTIVEIMILIIWNDLHFYIFHRLFHDLHWLRKYHMVHHQFRPASPFAAYAFHPIEALALGSVLPLVMILYEFSVYSLFVLPIWSIMINTLSHTNSKFLSMSIKHQNHHYYHKGNYSFFFNFWDHLFSPKF